mmetsp:Transcript_135716/g.421668  ORF Transcript_135716/g.421668 Transcript_135716/m.421668 type:complete len:242 (+) Transcript_135716:809-1534(+)
MLRHNRRGGLGEAPALPPLLRLPYNGIEQVSTTAVLQHQRHGARLIEVLEEGNDMLVLHRQVRSDLAIFTEEVAHVTWLETRLAHNLCSPLFYHLPCGNCSLRHTSPHKSECALTKRSIANERVLILKLGHNLQVFDLTRVQEEVRAALFADQATLGSQTCILRFLRRGRGMAVLRRCLRHVKAREARLGRRSQCRAHVLSLSRMLRQQAHGGSTLANCRCEQVRPILCDFGGGCEIRRLL